MGGCIAPKPKPTTTSVTPTTMPYTEARVIVQDAIHKADINTCKELTEQVKRDWCYWIVALSSNDVKICDQIQHSIYKDGCYMGVAMASNTISLCDSVKLEDHAKIFATKKRCKALVNGDLSVCDQITEPRAQREACYLTIATALKDMSMCDKITDSSSKDLCVSEVKSRY
jgi:hypothetical protein